MDVGAEEANSTQVPKEPVLMWSLPYLQQNKMDILRIDAPSS